MGDRVRLRHGLLIHAGHSGIWAALGRGDYEEEDIDCVITRGFGSENTIRDVAAQEIEVGEVDLTVSLMARSQGLPVTGIGALYHRSQHVLFSLEESGIGSPAELRGKSVGVTQADAGYVLLPAFLNHVGLSLQDLKVVFLRAEEKVQSLLTRKVDALLTYAAVNGPALEAAAAREGQTFRALSWADHGFDPVSNGFVVSEALLREKADLFRRFLRATYRGIVWALSHPEGAADLFVTYHPQIDAGLARLQWKRTIPLILTDDSRREGLGFLPEDKLRETTRALQQRAGDPPVPAGVAFTNDLLPERADRLPQGSGVP